MTTVRITLLVGLVALAAGCSDSTDVIPEGSRWLSIAPVQCGGNAWDRAPDSSILEFYTRAGVEFLDLRTSRFLDAVCSNCACFSGERIDVLVHESDVGFLLGEGFVREENWCLTMDDPNCRRA